MFSSVQLYEITIRFIRTLKHDRQQYHILFSSNNKYIYPAATVIVIFFSFLLNRHALRVQITTYSVKLNETPKKKKGKKSCRNSVHQKSLRIFTHAMEKLRRASLTHSLSRARAVIHPRVYLIICINENEYIYCCVLRLRGEWEEKNYVKFHYIHQIFLDSFFFCSLTCLVPINSHLENIHFVFHKRQLRAKKAQEIAEFSNKLL